CDYLTATSNGSCPHRPLGAGFAGSLSQGARLGTPCCQASASLRGFLPGTARVRCYSGAMPPDFWALLAEPFPRTSCTWRVAGLADDLQTARLARTLSRTTIAARLDEVVGPSDWTFQLLPLGERSLVCNLSIAGVGRSGVATVADGLQ